MNSIKVERPSKQVLNDLSQLSSATAWGTLSKMGVPSVFMRGIVPLKTGFKMVGPAQTLKYLPMREDKRPTPDQYRTSPTFQLPNKIHEGDIVVVDAGGVGGYGGMGDVIITAFVVKGVGGMVFDGAFRDSPYVRTLPLPVFSRGTQPSVTPRLIPYAANIPIQCARVLVEPGDVLIGDDDGVVVIPKGLVETVVQKGLEQEQLEIYSRKILEAGRSLSEAYPPRPEWTANPPI